MPPAPVENVIRLCVNGREESLAAPASVAGLVALRRPRPPFAVEVNKRLVRRGAWETTTLADGDVVEIVTLVGGG
jgi:thiamine biosynthesis protein ThiS